MPKWDAAEAMRLIEAERVTYFVGVPLMSFEILTHPDRDRYVSVRGSSGVFTGLC